MNIEQNDDPVVPITPATIEEETAEELVNRRNDLERVSAEITRSLLQIETIRAMKIQMY
jgi:hypothetical protein